jgi:hypothetical protein
LGGHFSNWLAHLVQGLNGRLLSQGGEISPSHIFLIFLARQHRWMLQGLVSSQESAALASRQPAKLIVFAAF